MWTKDLLRLKQVNAETPLLHQLAARAVKKFALNILQHVEHEEQPLQQCMVASIMLACKGVIAESTIPFLDELSLKIAKWAKVATFVV